jgi:4-diphosphocytidyl-2-C-methyl-D-erythritol kinase
MMALRDTARAKLNLTLEVLGRRADGYHEVRGLVAFTELGDSLELEPGRGLALAIEGPFAGTLRGDNLITVAAEAARTIVPGVRLGGFRLFKALPVAAGLGGGSADAAAALRLLARANPGALSPSALAEIAARIGSDVTACLKGRPALMTGRGETVTPVQDMPPCAVLLVNPGTPLTTANVYGTLNAAPFCGEEPQAAPDFSGSFARLIGYAAPRGTDLEAAALRLAPVTGEILAALQRLDGARLVRMAGSGPTCFTLFATQAEAKEAAAELRAPHPNWWIEATMLLPN